MQYSKIALAVMLTAAATAVSATDIQIYGRVDAGLMFEDADGGERSLTMKSGGRTSSRLGFNIKEDLGNGNFVKVYLENGFKVDDGSFSTADTLFDRRAILAVQGAWGELGLGRAGTVQSTAAPYSMGSIKWDVFGTSYSNSSIGTTFANSSRVDNAINYVSPVMNNLKFGLSYSTGDKDDDDANEWQDKGHTFAAAMNYIGDNLFLGVTFANVDNKHPGGTAADGRAYQVGGNRPHLCRRRLSDCLVHGRQARRHQGHGRDGGSEGRLGRLLSRPRLRAPFRAAQDVDRRPVL